MSYKMYQLMFTCEAHILFYKTSVITRAKGLEALKNHQIRTKMFKICVLNYYAFNNA